MVYVRVPDRERPTFKGVEVKVGPRAGDVYVIRSGLEEGQEVVTKGNFKIDSALQLLAKPSMMNPQGGGPVPTGHAGHGDMQMEGDSATPSMKTKTDNNAEDKRLAAPEAFLMQLAPLYDAYLKAQQALAGDDEKEARVALDQVAAVLNKVDMSLVKDKAHMQWMELSRQLEEALEHRMHMQGIKGARNLFLNLSPVMIRLERTFGHAGKAPHRIAFCPMADDGKGAEWLQTEETVSNPYYGEAMLRCGEIRETIPGVEAREGPNEKAE